MLLEITSTVELLAPLRILESTVSPVLVAVREELELAILPGIRLPVEPPGVLDIV